jgi:hypothetical protein
LTLHVPFRRALLLSATRIEERIMRGKAFVAATAMAAALLGVQPAAAQQDRTYHDAHVAAQQQCQQSRQSRMIGGAVIGGILGAVVGHNAAGSHAVRDEGRVLGAVVGAAAGGAIGRSTARCESVPQGAYDPYYGQAYGDYRDDDYYRGSRGDEDLYGGPYEDDYYGDDDYYRGGY